jgi:hypothetical protein
MFLFSFFALASLVVAGSIPHVPRSEITCTPLWGASGTLMMQNVVDLATTIQVGLINSTLQEDVGSDQRFIFQNCTSSFMNLTQSESLGFQYYYG